MRLWWLAALLFLCAATLAQEKTAKPKPDTPEQAADKVLAEAKDGKALRALAEKDEPDPWLVADELCFRGEHDSAEAFAKAAPRKDVEKLPAYVASQRGKPANTAAREALAAANKALAAEDAEAALAAIKEMDTKIDDVVSVGLRQARGSGLRSLRRLEESASAFVAAADAAERLGWLQGTASALQQAGSSALLRSDTRGAFAAWERLLVLERSRANRAGEAEALNGIGNIHLRLGAHAKALDHYERSLKLMQELGHRGIAGILVNIGMVHHRLGAHAKALEYLERGLKLGGDPQWRLNAVENIGMIHHRLGANAKALEYLQRALELSEELGDRARVAGALRNIGAIQISLGSYAKALDHSERALELMEELGNRFGVGAALMNIGIIHQHLGSYAKALECYERALGLAEQLGIRVGAARTLANIGVVHQNLGDYAKALDYNERALKVLKELGDRSGIAGSLINIGIIHKNLGSYAKALEYYERALELAETIGHQQWKANALVSTGMIHAILGASAKALEYYERALKIQEELGDRSGMAANLINTGAVHQNVGAHAKALEYYERGLKLAETMGHQPWKANALANIGHTHSTLGAHARAIEYHERSRKLMEELGDRVGVARGLASIGDVHQELGNLKEARRFLERSVRAARSLRATPVLVSSLSALAQLHLEAGKPSRALAAAQRALGKIEGLLGGLGEEQGAQAREQHATLFAVGTLAAVREEDVAEAFTFLESGRAGALLDALGKREALRWKAESLPPELRRVDLEAQANERAARRAYDAAVKRRKREEIRAAAQELDDATENVREVAGRIQRALKQQARLFYPRAETIDTIQAALDEDQALVLYGLCLDEALALVLRHDGERIVSLGKAADITAASAAFDATDPEVDPTAALAALRELLVDPLKLGADVKRVLLSPEGSLCYLPFGALFEQPVAMTPSGTTHVLLLNEERAKGEGILALGDPEYKGASKGAQAIYYRGRTLSPLPATRKEAEAIGTTTLLGAKASEAGLYRALPTAKRWRAVHFGCHGLVNVEQPMLSSLALAREGDHDGFLTALEVLRTKIPADLAVLSACETARGKIVKGEGIVGLTRAFMFAGTPRVICSLWKVDDEATQALMVKFYELWKTQPTATALKNAQAFVRGHDKWKHPYYWAAWQLWGLPD